MTYLDTAVFPSLSHAEVRARLLARQETALLDVREEDPFAQEHPLWAANLPLSRIELDAFRRIPRRDTVLVLYGRHEGEDLAPRAARKLAALGYTGVHLLEGGLDGWRAAGEGVVARRRRDHHLIAQERRPQGFRDRRRQGEIRQAIIYHVDNASVCHQPS